MKPKGCFSRFIPAILVGVIGVAGSQLTVAAEQSGVAAENADSVNTADSNVTKQDRAEPNRAKPKIVIWLSGHARYYEETVTLLETAVRASSPDVDLTQWDISRAQPPPPEPGTLVVAIGTEGTRHVLEKYPDADLISLFVPRVTWECLLASSPPRQGRSAVVYLGQPVRRQLLLGRLLKPSARQVAAVLGPVSRALESDLRQVVADQGLSLDVRHMAATDNPVTVMTPLVKNSDLFIAIPDQGGFNRVVAKWLLYLGFRYKIPVVGYSQAYTNAGALASVFSSPQDLARQGAELILAYLQNDALSGELSTDSPSIAAALPVAGAIPAGGAGIWQATYPRYYSLSINPTVARALGIRLPSETDLYRLFEKADQEEMP